MPGVSSKTALLCLDRIGASDSAVAPNAVINVDDDAEDRVLPVENLIAIARNSGLQLRSASFDWHALLAASTMKTVLVVLRNGNVVLVLGSGRDGIEEIAVSDPLYRNGDPFFLPRLNLEHAWGGEALVLKPRRSQAERTLAWCLSILSVCGLSAGLLLVSQAAVDGRLAGSNPLPRATAAVASSNRSAADDAQSTAAVTNADVQRAAVSGVVDPPASTAAAALPDIGETSSAAEAQKPEQQASAIQQQESEARVTAAAAPAQAPAPASADSGDKSAQPSSGEVPKILARLDPAPAAQNDAVSAQPVGLSLSPGEIAALLTRGDALIAKGDIASARLLYERAAEAADGPAALRLAESYDPGFLARARLSGARGDPSAAARWYRRARELGVSEAEILLQTLSPEKDQ